MSKQSEPWGIYYLANSGSDEWILAFEVQIATKAELEHAESIGSLVKAELKCYAVRLLKGHTEPKLAREQVRALGKPSPLSQEQEIEMQARFMSWSLTGNYDWQRGFEGALHSWRKMPLVDKMKFLPKPEGAAK